MFRLLVYVFKVFSSDKKVQHRAGRAPEKRAESLHRTVHHQSHHGHEVLPGQNVPRGGFRGVLSVHAGELPTNGKLFFFFF